MFLNNEKEQTYEAYKKILPKTKNNKGGYVRLPSWLIDKKVIITHQDSVEVFKKKVTKNGTTGFISFPTLLIGLVIKIENE